ncbi:MAG: hypothetical protein PF487_14235 [Bacteroidales bacterium]|jgi:hypothetical protein|nr:hypothetical protein [Bacteroidales bacterium]
MIKHIIMRALFLYIIISMIALSTCFGQIMRKTLPNYYLPIDSASIAQNKENKIQKSSTYSKMNFRMSMGTGITSMSGIGTSSNTYLAPSIDYRLNENLNFHFSGIFSSNNMFNENNFNSTNIYNQPNNNWGVSGSGNYKIGNKTNIIGSGVYYNNSQSVFDQQYTNSLNQNYSSVAVGVNYKISENVHIGAQVRFSNGINPYYNNPIFSGYNNNFNNMYSPFFW